MVEVLDRPVAKSADSESLERLSRVLIIEDTPDIRNLLRFLLQSTGIQVMAVGDGKSAMELIECWPAPDVILLDRMLPYIDGDQLLRAIRAEPTWSHVPIIVVSAKAQSEEIAEAMAAGATEYITKPFSPVQVMKVMEKYLPK